MATALRLASWTVVEAATGAELMRAAHCCDFDLIVLDVMLPRSCSSAPVTVPMIAWTASLLVGAAI